MYIAMMSISLSVIGLLFTFQGTQAYPFNIISNHNSTDMLSLNNYVHLTHAKTLRNDLININNSIEHLIKQLDYWVFSEIVKISNNSLDIDKLRSLEDSFEILQQKVTNLSLQLSKKNYNLDEIYFESKNLQFDLNNLQVELNNTVTKEYQLLNDYLGSNSMVDIFYNLTEQKSYLDMQIEEERETHFAEDCIRAAEIESIYEAAFFLNSITNSSKIEYIAEQLSLVEAFELAEAIRNISKSFILYKTIYKGVSKLVDTDKRLSYIMRLIEGVKEDIIDQPKTPEDLRSEAIEIHNDLSSQLQSLFYSKLLDLHPTRYCDQSDPWFFHGIIIADYALASKILYNLSTGSVRHRGLIDCFLSNIFYGTIHMGYALNYPLFLKYYDESFRNTNESYENFQNFVDQLPPIVNRIVFSEKVCLINIGSGLHLRSSKHSHDNGKYTIYTKDTDIGHLPEAIWKLTHVENYIFFIQNVGVADTYLDTDLSNEDMDGEHAVYGWHKPTNIGKWKFELSSGLRHVSLKNLARNELLYASNETDNFAFTKSTELLTGNHYQWDIVNCDS